MPPRLSTSSAAAPSAGWIDRAAILLSGLCLVHCLASAVLVAAAATLAGPLLDPIVHEIGLGIALVLGGIGLGRGLQIHGRKLPALIGGAGLLMMATALALGHAADLLAVAGVVVLAAAHILNRRALA